MATTSTPSYTLTGLTGGTAYAYAAGAVDAHNRTSQFAQPITFYTGTVRFTNLSYNGSIGAGQSTQFGYQGTGTGAGMTPTCSAALGWIPA